MYFGIFGVFVKQIVIFNIGFGFCVFNSIWEHRLKIFSAQKVENTTPHKSNKKIQKCEQFSYGTFGRMFLGFLVPLRR